MYYRQATLQLSTSDATKLVQTRTNGVTMRNLQIPPSLQGSPVTDVALQCKHLHSGNIHAILYAYKIASAPGKFCIVSGISV